MLPIDGLPCFQGSTVHSVFTNGLQAVLGQVDMHGECFLVFAAGLTRGIACGSSGLGGSGVRWISVPGAMDRESGQRVVRRVWSSVPSAARRNRQTPLGSNGGSLAGTARAPLEPRVPDLRVRIRTIDPPSRMIWVVLPEVPQGRLRAGRAVPSVSLCGWPEPRPARGRSARGRARRWRRHRGHTYCRAEC